MGFVGGVADVEDDGEGVHMPVPGKAPFLERTTIP